MIKPVMVLFILLVLLTPTALAAELETPESCDNTQWYNPETWFPCFFESGLAAQMNSLYDMGSLFENLLTKLSTVSIPISEILPYWAKLNYLAGFFFILVLIYTGYLFIFSAVDLQRKVQAKKQMWNVFLIILFSNLSIFFAALVLELSSLITNLFWSILLQEQISNQSMMGIIFSLNPIVALLYFTIFLVFGIPLLFKMLIRIIILIVCVAMSPLIVVTYFFLPTKEFGAQWVKIFFINAFFPVIWILVFTFGKIITNILIGDMLFVADMAHIFVFAATLYLNNYLYKKLALDLSLKTIASKTVTVAVTIYKAVKTVGAMAAAA